MSQLRLATFHIPRVKNELCDYLSRDAFDELLGRNMEEMAKEAFAKMDIQLDLFAEETAAKTTEWKLSDLFVEFPVFKTLKEGRSFVDDEGVQWARTSSRLYREVICAPASHVKAMCKWAHKTNGHRGVERTRWFYEKHLVTTPTKERMTNETLSEVCLECECS